MCAKIPARIRPTQGFSHFVHILLNVLLPIISYVLVRIDFVSVAIALVLLAKWRMFAVRPRYWLANSLSNGLDIIFSLSVILFMANTAAGWWQIFWAIVYILWLTVLKPRSDVLSVSGQAMIGQLAGLAALYIKFGDASIAGLIAGTWLITYVSARHFFTSFEEPHTALMAQIWAYFSACLAFILGHWLLFYGIIAQIIILLTTIGYALAVLYYLSATERLNKLIQRQTLAIVSIIVIIVIVLSDWSGSTL